MKQVFFFLLFIVFFSVSLCAQKIDSNAVKVDTAVLKIDSTLLKTDSSSIALDTAALKRTDSLLNLVLLKHPSLTDSVKFLLSNRAKLNITDTPVQLKKESNKDFLFYLVTFIVLLLAVFKYIYNRYFTNLFKVFFNSSLRQNQLTDQLLQSKFPSLVFNLFFIVSGGFYIYLILLHYNLIDEKDKWIMMGLLIALVGLVYFLKFCTLKFTGWVTGLKEVTNIYIFIIFLINKIIGIFLVPFIVILSFSDSSVVKIAVIISLMSIGLLLLLRFFRSYGLLQNQLKISRFHFILYIAGIELLPLLLIYKGLMIYLTKNL